MKFMKDLLQLSDGSKSVGLGTVIDGVAKAWGRHNGGSTLTTLDSLNISSLTDSGVGDWKWNFTSVFADGNYATTGQPINASSGVRQYTTLNTSAAATEASFIFINASSVYADRENASVFLGDLA